MQKDEKYDYIKRYNDSARTTKDILDYIINKKLLSVIQADRLLKIRTNIKCWDNTDLNYILFINLIYRIVKNIIDEQPR